MNFFSKYLFSSSLIFASCSTEKSVCKPVLNVLQTNQKLQSTERSSYVGALSVSLETWTAFEAEVKAESNKPQNCEAFANSLNFRRPSEKPSDQPDAFTHEVWKQKPGIELYLAIEAKSLSENELEKRKQVDSFLQGKLLKPNVQGNTLKVQLECVNPETKELCGYPAIVLDLEKDSQVDGSICSVNYGNIDGSRVAISVAGLIFVARTSEAPAPQRKCN
jgi:hypothetical protein